MKDIKTKIEEERLREAACFGDLEALDVQIRKGVNLDAKHAINGWTALHWASKRDQLAIVKALLENGADKTVLTNSGELAVQLTKDQRVIEALSCPDDAEKTEQIIPATALPIVPNYLRDPPINYKVDTGTHKPLERNGQQTRLPGTQSVTEEQSGRGVATRPRSNLEELILKIRIAETGDPDFIEVELPNSLLTYENLVKLVCTELRICEQYIERIRKLPNTILRRDKEVQRLTDYTEIEVVLLASKALQEGVPAAANILPSTSTPSTSANNGYQSISVYKNQTVLY